MSLAAAAGTAPHHYGIYGLRVASDLLLEGLPPAGTEASGLTIARTPLFNPATADRPTVFDFSGAAPLLAWQPVGAFRITSAERIDVSPAKGADDRLVSLPLLGGVLAALLHRRGFYVLHASAVAIEGRAVVLLGDKGAGKSTAAAALLAAGHRLLADDVVALDLRDPERPLVLPAFGQIKLRDDAAGCLASPGINRLWQWDTRIDKANYDARIALAPAPVPLGRFYLLQRAAQAATVALPTPEALGLLLEHSYMSRFGEAGYQGNFAGHFARSARFAASGLVKRLDVPDGLARIAAIVATLQNDLCADLRA
jgi:hypothetical protein